MASQSRRATGFSGHCAADQLPNADFACMRDGCASECAHPEAPVMRSAPALAHVQHKGRLRAPVICAQPPSTLAEVLPEVNGADGNKLAEYGQQILDILAGTGAVGRWALRRRDRHPNDSQTRPDQPSG